MRYTSQNPPEEGDDIHYATPDGALTVEHSWNTLIYTVKGKAHIDDVMCYDNRAEAEANSLLFP